MTKLIAYVQALLAAREDSERGATMVEYGLMVALIAVFCIAAVEALGSGVSATFDSITAKL